MSGAILKDRRSKVFVNFYKLNQEDVPEYYVSDVRLVNAGSDGCPVSYFPATRQVVDRQMTHTGRAVNVNPVSDGEAESMIVGGQEYNVVPRYQASAPVFIPSAIYLPKEKVVSMLKAPDAYVADSDYLYLAFTFTQAGRVSNIKIPLSDRAYNEFEPMSTYTFNVVVTSLYQSIAISVHVDSSGRNAWDEVEINEKIGDNVSQNSGMSWTITDWNSTSQEENI